MKNHRKESDAIGTGRWEKKRAVENFSYKDIVSITQCGFVFVNGTSGKTFLGDFSVSKIDLGF
jgi:hypothetical protein